MDKFIIQGGSRLKGEIRVSGSKNAALPVLAACILAPENCLIKNVPDLRDIDTIKKLLIELGVEFEVKNDCLLVKAQKLDKYEAPYELVKTMRASVLLLGPLLARCGKARVSLPGGCAIGQRPINLHLAGLKKLGAQINLEGGYIEAKAVNLTGNKIHFDIPTVTGTMNLLMACVFSKGESILTNCAKEPEVCELVRFLRKMGAKIEGEGSAQIKIQGVKELKGVEYRIIPDRIETGTMISTAAITGSEFIINGVIPDHLETVIEKFKEAGVSVDSNGDNSLKVIGPDKISSVDISTSPYPGFPTDMQAQFMALMTLAEGSSVIEENIFEGRFMHVAELRRMGANIKQKGSSCVVKGVKSLRGAPVMATDLRASACLVIAGLAAKGKTEVRRIYHLDRGYEQMELKLKSVGADCIRVKE